MTLAIRPFEDADEAQVLALWEQAFPGEPPHNAPAASIARKRAWQRELFFVGVRGGRVVATVLAGYDGHRGWLYSVAVEAGLRRAGIATRMVRHAEEALARLGCPKVNLQVRSSNAEVIGFYRALGYAVEERVSMGRRLEGAAA